MNPHARAGRGRVDMPRARAIRQLVCLAAVAVLGTFAAPSAADAATCDRFAAVTGSDGNAGTSSAPFRTFFKLANALSPGQTGCLRGGTYAGSGKVTKSGTATAPITVTSSPGEKVTVKGRLWAASNHVRYEGLHLNGNTGTIVSSPTITGSYNVFRNNDVSNDNTAICFDVGSVDGYGKAVGTVIDHNRIHHCGILPAKNHDHGIYVENSEGARITNNVIHDNADRGVQLYPNAQGTYVAYNIIDGNGEGVLFAGGTEGGRYWHSDNNVVERNVISFSKLRHDVEAFWDGAVGTGNVLRTNCIYGGKSGTIQTPQRGFTISGNVIANPLYVDRAAKDFRLGVGSPCASILGTAAPGIESAPTSVPAPTSTPGTTAFPTVAALAVAWNRPLAGAVVRGILNEASANCRVSVTGGAAIDRVEFLLDGRPLNVERSAPWSCTWDTATSTVGPHTLRAVAYDVTGLSGSASTTMTVAR